MAGERRQPAHRAIIYGGILGGMSNERINELLAQVGARPLVRSSYESIRDHYKPFFEEDMTRLGDAIEHPPTWSRLKEVSPHRFSGSSPASFTDSEDEST